MTDQTIADKLQHQVEFGSYNWATAESLMLEAAAELRRLHEENQTLRAALKQPPRQPLTDEQIKLLIPDGDEWKYEVGFAEATEFARAIEAAHGIGGEA